MTFALEGLQLIYAKCFIFSNLEYNPLNFFLRQPREVGDPALIYLSFWSVQSNIVLKAEK